tara:strand:- start:2955 stop:3407 length:453 start_codon:yes stop_codon:yes gene_type:complete
MTDTVGFIRKLPTQLVDSFKSTLTEITEADLLIHVVDISHKNFEDHISSVNIILSEINVNEKPTIMLFNKTDKYIKENINHLENHEIGFEDKSLANLKISLKKNFKTDIFFISALRKLDINAFRNELYKKVREIHITRFPYNAFLYPDIK